jgi:competence protein ComGC
MLHRLLLLVLLIVPALLLAFLPSATAQTDGESSCAAELAAATSGATRW